MSPNAETMSGTDALILSTVAVTLAGDSSTGLLAMTRGDTGNAMDAELLDDLVAALEWCTRANRLGALIITGTGGVFSLGGDLRTLRRGVSEPEVTRCSAGYLADQLGRAVTLIDDLEYPVIAAVDGRAGGGGFSLALACDTRIASTRAVFDFAYARIGATPDGGMTWFLPRIVGVARAAELMVESPIIRAPRALTEGLVQQVVAVEELARAADVIAARMARQPRHYVAAVKRMSRAAEERNTLAASLSSEAARGLLFGEA
jgi:2-(1,2-epoxy-1,2-dihydrophenyl)acetyl-CoA isomerase